MGPDKIRASGLGPEAGGFNQPHLIAAGCEFPALVTLDHNTATGFDPDDPGANPTQSRGLQNFDHITGLKIQLHARNEETTKGGASDAPWRTRTPDIRFWRPAFYQLN